MKKIIVLIMTATLLLMLPGFLDNKVQYKASAASELDNLYSQLNELEKRQDALNKSLNATKNSKKQETEKLNDLNDEIDVIEGKIDVLNGIIKNLNNQLADKEKELEKASGELGAYYETYRQRVRANYEEGQSSYIEVLLDSSDFSDFLIRLDIVQQIIEHDNDLIASMENKCTEIKTVKQDIENKKKQNDTAKAKLAASQSTLEGKVKQSQTIIKNLSAAEKQYMKEIIEAENALNALNDKIDEYIDKNKAFVGGGFLWPVPGKSYISSYFGYRKDPFTGAKAFHSAIDIPAPVGYRIIASNAGTIAAVGWDTNGGNYVVVDHGGGYSTRYFHCNKIIVSKGQNVAKGQQIAEVGATGKKVTGPHLHFDFRINGNSVNPLNYVKP